MVTLITHFSLLFDGLKYGGHWLGENGIILDTSTKPYLKKRPKETVGFHC
jgi:hypothetical protein